MKRQCLSEPTGEQHTKMNKFLFFKKQAFKGHWYSMPKKMNVQNFEFVMIKGKTWRNIYFTQDSSGFTIFATGNTSPWC
jgi:hypothetical protein